MLYRNPDNTAITIRGISLAHRSLTPVQRAFVAADIVTGALIVKDPTIKQAAAIVGAGARYTRYALRADPADRDVIEAGGLPLADPYGAALERAIRAAGVDAAWAIIEKII